MPNEREKLLEHRITELEAEILQLRQRLAFFENHPTIAGGIRGESLIAKMLGGDLTRPQSSSDVYLGELHFEVKFSRLNTPNLKSPNSKRWSWPKVLGGSKSYDRLILVGEPDERFRENYADPNCAYVLFDVPFDAIESISQSGGLHRNIQLTTNPRTARQSFAAPLFTEYQVTVQELESRYVF